MSIDGEVIIILGCAGFIAYKIYKHKEKLKAERIYKLSIITTDVNIQIDKAKNLKTATARVNALEKAANLLKQAAVIKNYQEVFPSYQHDLDKVMMCAQVFPVVNYFEKAQKQRFKNKDNPEKNALLDALYEIKTKDLTDEDFEFAQVLTDQGELINVSIIESRLRELGWENGEDINLKEVKKKKIIKKPEHKEKMTEDGRYIID